MKCTNKFSLISFALIMAFSLSACKQEEIRMPFSDFECETVDTSVTFSKDNSLTTGFSFDLATFVDDYTEAFNLEGEGAGILVDINNKKVLFAQNAFEQRYPASITKIFTAYIALKYCKSDELITVTEDVLNISVPGAVKLGLKPGDTLTLDQALHLCLISSYNDVAVAIACHVSGSEEDFANLMNEEAKLLGATSSHFTDASGLGGEDHYTSVYDLYLIFSKAVENSDILEIIQCNEYQTIYHNSYNDEVIGKAKSTNLYFAGNYSLPENVTVVGGKTGTTDEAGSCLMILSRDAYSNPYIAIILGANSKDKLYTQMTELLLQISK